MLKSLKVDGQNSENQSKLGSGAKFQKMESKLVKVLAAKEKAASLLGNVINSWKNQQEKR